ncbi:LPS export ABC transporter periplasmic protein LptC [bacterium]|nr:LPS export ABC transporter periplasmic protein LptC [bacterium]
MEFQKDILPMLKSRWAKMDKRQRVYFYILLAVSFVLVWAFVSAGVITGNFNRSMVKSGGDKQELHVSSMILTETKDGQKFWEIYGETGQYSSDRKVAYLNNIVGNFYKDNAVEMSFESTHGLYNEEKQEIVLYDNVFVVLKDDTSLTADKLTYDIPTKSLVSEGNVTIKRKKSFHAKADAATIDSEYSHFKIMGNTCSKVYN